VSVNTKRVFYVRNLADPVFADILGRRDDVRLDRLENESPEQLAGPILAAAHVYQVAPPATKSPASSVSMPRRSPACRRC